MLKLSEDQIDALAVNIYQTLSGQPFADFYGWIDGQYTYSDWENHMMHEPDAKTKKDIIEDIKSIFGLQRIKI